MPKGKLHHKNEQQMTSTSTPVVTCPVCLSLENHTLVAPPEDYEYRVGIAGEFNIQCCEACGSEFVWPRPSIAELRQMYPATYYAYDQEMGRFWQALYELRCRGEAKRLLRLSTRRPLRLFDVGAGDCRHFKAIDALGNFELSGVEMNEKMAAAGRLAGFDIAQGTFEEYDPSDRLASVDILTMNHVIEHVIDPHETAKKVYSLLAPHGVFYGRTPKLASIGHRIFGRFWGGYHYPRHLHLYTGESLTAMLRQCGFREVEIIEDLNLFPALSLQNFLVGKLGLPLKLKGGHSRIWTLLVALTAPLSYFDYFSGRGDCMIFVARK